MSELVYTLLGSNLGDRAGYLRLARERMECTSGLVIDGASSIFESEAMEMSNHEPAFLNQVVEFRYDGTPLALLDKLEKIEKKLGRLDKGNLKSRTLDIDILFFGQLILNTVRLTIPHPRLYRRPFALVPLLELAPEFVDPLSHQPVARNLEPAMKSQVRLYNEHVSATV